jgi:hypothetical protein
VGHPQRPCGGVHPGDEPARRAGVPPCQNRGDVVRGRQQQRLQRLQFRQLLAGGDGNDRLVLSAPAVGVGDVGVGERDRRAVAPGPERVVAEHEVRRHHLRDARDRGRMLVRAGLDLRLTRFHERGLAVRRPHRARHAVNRLGGRCCRRGGQQPVAEGRADRRDDDHEAGDEDRG